ncbi:hypothetical protein [Stappia stellulata]|uniref:hypothetical protein n=1 Tax=Stappia stellulata TaxID=71235 RepID=UPI0012EC800A|nr:hypothetical protein [Stappia stellulata]
MITLRKRTPVMKSPAIVVGVFLAAALGATEMLSAEPTAPVAQTGEASKAGAGTKSSAKGDLKVDLSDVRDRHVRCVSRVQETTCTGWPVTVGSLAYNGE